MESSKNGDFLCRDGPHTLTPNPKSLTMRLEVPVKLTDIDRDEDLNKKMNHPMKECECECCLDNEREKGKECGYLKCFGNDSLASTSRIDTGVSDGGQQER